MRGRRLVELPDNQFRPFDQTWPLLPGLLDPVPRGERRTRFRQQVEFRCRLRRMLRRGRQLMGYLEKLFTTVFETWSFALRRQTTVLVNCGTSIVSLLSELGVSGQELRHRLLNNFLLMVAVPPTQRDHCAGRAAEQAARLA